MRGVFVREHAKAVALYDQVTVLHLAGSARQGKLESVTDPALTEGLPIFRSVYRKPLSAHMSFPFFLWNSWASFRQLYRQGYRPDVLHAHVHRAGFLAVMLGKRYKIPVVITEHNSAFPRRLHNRFNIALARYAFEQADWVLPVSQSLQKGIEAYGIRANFRVIPNCIQPAIFFPPPLPLVSASTRRLLFVGSLLPVKGLSYLIEALGSLNAQSANWHLDIVGDGPERSKHEQQAQALGLSGHITFHGYQPKIEIARLMREADFFVLPSLWENQPCVLNEAMSCGLPILSTTAGGIPEMVDEHIGILAPAGDAAALAGALRKALSNELHFDRDYIVRAAAKYQPEVVGKTIHEVYEDALARHRKRPS